jgi:hypothetical protein
MKTVDFPFPFLIQVRHTKNADFPTGTIDLQSDNTKFDNTKFDNTKFDNTKFDNTKFDNTKFNTTKDDNTKFDTTSFNRYEFGCSTLPSSTTPTLIRTTLDKQKVLNSTQKIRSPFGWVCLVWSLPQALCMH